MTTLDGVERSFDEDGAGLRSRRPVGNRRDHGRRASRSLRRPPGCCSRSRPGTGEHSAYLAEARPALGRVEPLREAATPEMALRAQRRVELMVELCGARLVPGTIDVAAEVPEPHRSSCATIQSSACWGCRSRWSSASPTWSGSTSRSSTAATTSWRVPSSPLRRHPGGGSDRGGGPIHGYAANLPSTLPATGGEAGRLSREQALRRRAEDAMRDLGFDAIVSLSLTDPGMQGRLRIGRRPSGRADPGLQSALRRALGGAHRAARIAARRRALQRRARRRPGGARRIESRLSARGRAAAGRRPGRVRRRPPRPGVRAMADRYLAAGPCAGGWRRSVEADFYALKGVLEALAAQLGVGVEVAPGEEPSFIPAGAVA